VFPVYSAQHLADAQMLVDMLRERNVEAFIKNASLQGMIGELPATTWPQVCVLKERDLGTARMVVEAYERRKRAPIGDDRTCEACGESSPGNFELCWKCRRPLPDP
jgi:hypothetical protein